MQLKPDCLLNEMERVARSEVRGMRLGYPNALTATYLLQVADPDQSRERRLKTLSGSFRRRRGR